MAVCIQALSQLPGEFLHRCAFLVSRIVKYQVHRQVLIFRSDLAQHGTYFRGSYVSVIGNRMDFLRNVIQGSEHIITLASGKRPDEPPGFPVYVPKEVAPHNKMGSVKEKQGDIP